MDGREGVMAQNRDLFLKMLYSRVFFTNGDGDYETRIGLDNEVLSLLVEDLDEATAEGIQLPENNEVPLSP